MRKHTYRDDRGASVVLGSHCLGQGGEGAVYSIEGSPDWVAKIYSNVVSPEKVAKLAGMTRGSSPTLRKFAAWPDRTLHNETSDVRGFVMPRIKEVRSIHELYSPSGRGRHFPTADWRFLVRTARNCAAAFATLHESGVVIGDVNQGNVLVSSGALVTLIDCDSFQIRDNGRVHRCPVGVPEFTAPELQKLGDFKNVDRTENHDGFGLAVLIFHLLFMGRHPFAGRFLGADDMPIPRAIREERFAYGKGAARCQMEPPPHTLSLDELPGELADLFERAFASEKRPTARKWGSVLEAFEKQIGNCRNDPGHVHSKVLRRCPWCRIEKGGGPAFFISVSAAALVGRGATIDLESLWKEIDRLPLPSSGVTVAATNPAQVHPKPLPREFRQPLPEPPRDAGDSPEMTELKRHATALDADLFDLDQRAAAVRREFTEVIEKKSRESEERIATAINSGTTGLEDTVLQLDQCAALIQREFEEAIKKKSVKSEELIAAAIRDFERCNAEEIRTFNERQRRTEKRLPNAIRGAIGGVGVGLVLLVAGAVEKTASVLVAGILLSVMSAFTWFGLRMRLESPVRGARRRHVRVRACPEENLIRDAFRSWEQRQQALLTQQVSEIRQQVESIQREIGRVRQMLGRDEEFDHWKRQQHHMLAQQLHPIQQRAKSIQQELARVRETLGRKNKTRRALRMRTEKRFRELCRQCEQRIRPLRDERASILKAAEERLRAVQDGLRDPLERADADFRNTWQSLETSRGRAKELDRLKTQELQVLRDRARELQLEDHLKRLFIRDAGISGIGVGRVAVLQSYGIETAFDLAKLAARSVPGFGESLTRKLIAWREREERRFHFDPSKGIPPDARLAVEVKYQQEKAKLAASLKKEADRLRRITAEARSAATRLISDKARLEQEVAQARADLAVVDQAISEIQARLRGLST